jgi:endo-1,4-beta-xylanase
MKTATPYRPAALAGALLGLFLAPVRLYPADAPAPVAAPPAIPAAPAQEEAHPPSFPLWAGGAPGYEGRRDEPERVDWRQEPDIVFPVTFNIHNPSLTPFLPAPGKATGAAVIVAPGGGDMFLTMDREGYDTGRWLADHGVAAFVLKYRLARDRAGNSPYRVEVEALADTLRSIRTVRARAPEWGVDPARVGFLGFSAGGELAALAMSRYDAGNPAAADPIERLSSRPDFVGLIYPGIAAIVKSGGVKVDAQTPPAFLSCAADDQPATVANLTNLFLQLRQAGVGAELHIYSTGGHGYGVRQRPLEVTGWPLQLMGWMGDSGLLARP